MKLSRTKALATVAKNGTGKTQRNLQMWETAHQVLVEGEYKDIIIPDATDKPCWSRESHQER